MKFKKLAALATCAALGSTAVLGLVACGNRTDNNNGNGDGDGTLPPVNLTDDLKFDEYGDPIFFDENNKAITLKVWSIVGEPDNAYLDKVNTQFNDYYSDSGVSAKITSIVNGDFYTQYTQILKTDAANAPDVLIFHSERLPLLASNNTLLPLDDFYTALGDNNTFSRDNYFDGVMEECIYNNATYGVPLDVHSGVWFVRQDILERNGLEVPTTLSEFVDVNNALIKKYNEGNLWTRAMTRGGAAQCAWNKNKQFGDNYNPVVMSKDGGIENGWIPQTAVFQNGGKLTDKDGKPAWNDEGLSKTMSMFRDWQNGTGTFNGTAYEGAFVAAKNDANTVWSKLASGEAVFSFEGPWWTETRLNEYEEVLGDLADPTSGNKKYAPLTTISPSKMFAFDESSATASKVYGVGHCFSVSRSVTSKTKAVAAALYAQYMTENSAIYTQGGHLPASKEVYNSEKFKSQTAYDRYLKQMGSPEDYIMLGGTPHYKEVYESLKQVYIETFTSTSNNLTIKQIIDAAYKKAINEITSADDVI